MRVLIPQADGDWIVCPQCRMESVLVCPAKVQMGLHAVRVATRHGWWLVECLRCGKKLYPHTEVVDLIESEASHV